MATRLILLRHAPIAAQYAGQMIGATDAPLAPLGEGEKRTLADRLARWAPQACYCSPMQRCRQTAAAAAPELPPSFDQDLREIDFGRWEARTFAEAAAQDPSLMDDWARFGPDFAFPGGERVEDFSCRVRKAAQRLARSDVPTALAITHGGVIRAMICHLLGLDARHYLAFDVPYLALAVIELFDGKGVLVALERPDALARDSMPSVWLQAGCSRHAEGGHG